MAAAITRSESWLRTPSTSSLHFPTFHYAWPHGWHSPFWGGTASCAWYFRRILGAHEFQEFQEAAFSCWPHDGILCQGFTLMRLLIYGSREFAATVSDLVRHCGHELMGMVDDFNVGAGIIGNLGIAAANFPPSEYGFAIAIGYSNIPARWK